MPQFQATINHIKEGVKSVTISQATKNIEGWEAALQEVDLPGADTIRADLGKLKEHLHADELDGEAIRKLVVKLGRETVAIAKRSDGEKAGKIQALGEALGQAAEDATAD